MAKRLIHAADDPDHAGQHLESPRKGEYIGVAASGRNSTMGSQFIIVAKDMETLRIAWNRLMLSQGIDLSEEGVVNVTVNVMAKAAGAVPQQSTINSQPA